MNEGDVVLYRALVTITHDDPEEPEGRKTFTNALGPYRAPAPAKVAAKAADADFQWYRRYFTNVVVTAVIEKANVTWERVE